VCRREGGGAGGWVASVRNEGGGEGEGGNEGAGILVEVR